MALLLVGSMRTGSAWRSGQMKLATVSQKKEKRKERKTHKKKGKPIRALSARKVRCMKLAGVTRFPAKIGEMTLDVILDPCCLPWLCLRCERGPVTHLPHTFVLLAVSFGGLLSKCRTPCRSKCTTLFCNVNEHVHRPLPTYPSLRTFSFQP